MFGGDKSAAVIMNFVGADGRCCGFLHLLAGGVPVREDVSCVYARMRIWDGGERSVLAGTTSGARLQACRGWEGLSRLMCVRFVARVIVLLVMSVNDLLAARGVNA